HLHSFAFHRFDIGHRDLHRLGARQRCAGTQSQRKQDVRDSIHCSLLESALPLDLFSVTAARNRVFNACSSIFSPSRKSIARLVLPSRLELKRRAGSFSAAPLANVSLTALL